MSILLNIVLLPLLLSGVITVSYTHLDVYKRQVRIFDYIEDEEGKKKAVLNKKETAIAQAKQELIKQGFQDWIWDDPCLLYTSTGRRQGLFSR